MAEQLGQIPWLSAAYPAKAEKG